MPGYRCGRKIAPKSSVGALGAPQEAFLAASVADRLVHTFLEASGVHFGSHFGLKNAPFLTLFSGPVSPFFELFFSTDIYYASPLKVDCFGRCQNKAHMACDPQKPMNFQCFAYARRRQPRSKEDNRGQIIAQKKDPTYVKKQQTKAHF
jgi:hypothetical protein